MDPIAATVAGLEPDKAAKKAEAITVMMPNPPGSEPTSDLAKSTNRRDMPPVSMNPPAIMKKGIAMNGNESTAVNIRCATTSGGVGMSPNTRAAMPERPSATPMGTLTTNRKRKIPNKIASMPMRLSPPSHPRCKYPRLPGFSGFEPASDSSAAPSTPIPPEWRRKQTTWGFAGTD